MTHLPQKPKLLFDADCGFCRYWVSRWAAMTGDRVDYLASQAVAREYPEIPPQKFEETVVFLDEKRHPSYGAEAVFRALATVPGKGGWLWAYQKLPWFRSLAETWYRKASEIDSKNCAIQYNLGLLYQDYKNDPSNQNLRQAQQFYNQYVSCGRTEQRKVDDARRRIKDIDDTFAALEQQKQMEAELKKQQEEMERQQKEMERQQQQQQADRTTTGSVNDPIRLDVGENRYFYLPPPGETR